MKNTDRKIGKFHMHMRQGLVSLKRGKEEINVNTCGDRIGFEAKEETRTISFIELAEYVFKKKIKKIDYGCAYCGKTWEEEQKEK